jgi:ATP-dependent helicase HrpB
MLASGDAEKNFDLIILDEFHERSLHTDLACSWIKQQNRVKLLVMSATLDVGPLNNFFPEAKHIDIKGRLYPVEKYYLKRALNFHDRILFNEKLLELCTHALNNHPEGNILVFLPGRSEIQRAKETLSLAGVEKQHKVEVHTLSSKEKKEDQNTALAEDLRRKIILSTNIAETSLTIPNVKVVIDSGLKRESNFNTKTGVQSLAVRRIALDSATQREGRAGRLEQGVCYKMWTSADEQRMRKTTPAEIHRIDPIELITKVMSFGHPFGLSALRNFGVY